MARQEGTGEVAPALWLRRGGRATRAVMTALESAGEEGMTPVALAVILDLPEAMLQEALERLTRDGLVTRRLVRRGAVSWLCRSRYFAIPV